MGTELSHYSADSVGVGVEINEKDPGEMELNYAENVIELRNSNLTCVVRR